MLDLQLIRVGSPGLDLNYLLFNSVNGTLRKKFLNHFLSIYHSSFSKIFIGKDEFPLLTCEEIIKEYRKKNKFGLLMAMMAIPIMLVEDDEAINFAEVNEDNMDEFNKKQKEKNIKQMVNNPYVRPRYLDMIDEMVQSGVLKKN